MGTERETLDETFQVHPVNKYDATKDDNVFMCINCFLTYKDKNQFVNHVRKCGKTKNLTVGTRKENEDDSILPKKSVARNDGDGDGEKTHPFENQSGSSKTHHSPALQIKEELVKEEDNNLGVSARNENNGKSVIRKSIDGDGKKTHPSTNQNGSSKTYQLPALQIKEELVRENDTSVGVAARNENKFELIEKLIDPHSKNPTVLMPSESCKSDTTTLTEDIGSNFWICPVCCSVFEHRVLLENHAIAFACRAENGISVTENLPELAENGVSVTENIPESAENSILVTENLPELAENGILVTENLPELAENGILVTENISALTENGISVTENLPVSTESGISVTENLPVSTESCISVTKNLPVLDDNLSSEDMRDKGKFKVGSPMRDKDEVKIESPMRESSTGILENDNLQSVQTSQQQVINSRIHVQTSKSCLTKRLTVCLGQRVIVCERCNQYFCSTDRYTTHKVFCNIEKRNLLLKKLKRKISCSKEESYTCTPVNKSKSGNRMENERPLDHIDPQNGRVSPASTLTKKKDRKECPVCFKVLHKHRMKGHRRVHTGEKPFVCGQCQSQFGRKDNLLKHLNKRVCERKRLQCMMIRKGISGTLINVGKKLNHDNANYVNEEENNSKTESNDQTKLIQKVSNETIQKVSNETKSIQKVSIDQTASQELSNETESIQKMSNDQTSNIGMFAVTSLYLKTKADIIPELLNNSKHNRIKTGDKVPSEVVHNSKHEPVKTSYKVLSDLSNSSKHESDHNYCKKRHLNYISVDHDEAIAVNSNETNSSTSNNSDSSVRLVDKTVAKTAVREVDKTVAKTTVREVDKTVAKTTTEILKDVSQLTKLSAQRKVDFGNKMKLGKETKPSRDNGQAKGLDKEDKKSAKTYEENYKFNCKYCQKVFHSLLEEKKHALEQLTYAKKRKATKYCKPCQMEFEFQCEFRYHIKNHNDEELLTCKTCNKVFACHKNVLRHMLIHKGQKDYKCSKCSAAFNQSNGLKFHMQTVHAEAGPSIKCKLCDGVFLHQRYLNTHVKRVHSTAVCLCSICGKYVKSEFHLKLHQRFYHSTQSIKCKVCDKTFKNKPSLNKHKLVHFDKYDYMCDICSKKFKSRKSLNLHLRTHTNEKRFKCDICNIKFTEKGSLKRHSVTHSRAKKYVCTVCDKSFTQSQSLTRHMITHTGKTPYRCEPCDLDFPESYRLKLHNEKVHTLVPQNSN